MPLAPTFIPFTPWTTLAGYRDFLASVADLDLVDQVAPIQLAIRLLIPEGSLLLDLAGNPRAGSALSTRAPWLTPGAATTPRWIALHRDAGADPVTRSAAMRAAADIFRKIWSAAAVGQFPDMPLAARATIPYLTEPWYC